jgi:DNA-binding transcriptional MerR regulator
MSIGEVLAHLRLDFPDATISKLRFLEAEGLVEPQRTAAGYRKYTWADVARLRYVLTAQRDHYLPLRVIREHLAALDAGPHAGPHAAGFPGAAGRTAAGPSGAPGGGSADADPVARLPRSLMAVHQPGDGQAQPGDGQAQPGEARLTRADLLARTGIAEPALAALEQHGLVRARAGGRYDADAIVIAEVAVELGRFGLEPRHLRGSRAAADREVGLYAQLVVPLARQPDPSARARAAEAVRELVTLSQRLHGALIRAGLRDTLGQ